MFAFVPLVLAYIMFCLGLQLRRQDFMPLLTMPQAVLVGVINQMLVVPLMAFALVWWFAPPPALGFGLMLLSFCSGGATSNLLSYYAGGDVALSVVLTLISSLFAMVSVPVLIGWCYPLFFSGQPLQVSAAVLGLQVLLLTGVPVILGMVLRHFFGEWVGVWQPRLQVLANVGFVLLVVGAGIQNWQVLLLYGLKIGSLALLMAAVLLLVGLCSARLSGLDGSVQVTLAIETSLQNGAMGIGLAALLSRTAATSLPEFALPSVLYGVLMNAIILPFVLYQRRRMHSGYAMM